jgi:hypothetical protein
MVGAVQHDSSPPSLDAEASEASIGAAIASDHALPWRLARAHAYSLEPAGAFCGELGTLHCRDVVGFDDALEAAEDAYAETPARVALVGLDPSATAWVARWAEDVEQVRRNLTIRRADGAEVTMVATVATYGPSVPVSLAVESIRVQSTRAILRSGVHPRAEVEAALGLHLATTASDDVTPS